jgi:hypothetical protein
MRLGRGIWRLGFIRPFPLLWRSGALVPARNSSVERSCLCMKVWSCGWPRAPRRTPDWGTNTSVPRQSSRPPERYLARGNGWMRGRCGQGAITADGGRSTDPSLLRSSPIRMCSVAMTTVLMRCGDEERAGKAGPNCGFCEVIGEDRIQLVIVDQVRSAMW